MFQSLFINLTLYCNHTALTWLIIGLQGRSQDFQMGGRFFIGKGKAGSERRERCLRTFMRLFGTGVPGGFQDEAPEDIPFPCI